MIQQNYHREFVGGGVKGGEGVHKVSRPWSLWPEKGFGSEAQGFGGEASSRPSFLTLRTKHW